MLCLKKECFMVNCWFVAYSYDCRGRHGEPFGLTIFNVSGTVEIADIQVYQYREQISSF